MFAPESQNHGEVNTPRSTYRMAIIELIGSTQSLVAVDPLILRVEFEQILSQGNCDSN